MSRFYEPDLSINPDSPFVRDASNKLVRRGYWMDMNDVTLVMVMTQGIGANLTNDEKRAHLIDLKRERLIDQVCIQEILPPEK
jgi:hypothetical protein